MPERVLIGGSREPTPEMERDCGHYVKRLPLDTVVGTGRARGIDSVAHVIAQGRWMETEDFWPDYERYHPKQAPKERNKVAADWCDRGVFFWDGHSTGTWHAINEVRKRGKPLDVYVLGHKVEDPSTLMPHPARHPRREVALL